METILIHYFLFVTIHFILTYKLNLQEKLKQTKFKILFSLGNCNFCYSFWVSVISVLILNGVLQDLQRIDFLYPFFIMGLHLVINKIFGNE